MANGQTGAPAVVRCLAATPNRFNTFLADARSPVKRTDASKRPLVTVALIATVAPPALILTRPGDDELRSQTAAAGIQPWRGIRNTGLSVNALLKSLNIFTW